MFSFSNRLSGILLAFIFVALSGAAVAEQVRIAMPVHEATVGSPFHLVASGHDSERVTGITVYINGVKTASNTGSDLDTMITAPEGLTRVTVQAFNRNGHFQRTIYVDVDSTSDVTEVAAPSLPNHAITIDNIEHLGGWDSCSECAGRNGHGPEVHYSMRHSASPSRDGKSAEFRLGGQTPYGAALWWKQLGAQDDARHFVYNVDFYIQDPKSAQALEFDVNQSVNWRKYIFGTECNLKTGVWDIWASGRSWVPTTVACETPAAFTWHHLTWEFERTENNMVRFVAVTLDGKKSYVNREFAPQRSHAREMNVAFQMDGDKHQNDYSVWLDNVKLTYW